VLALRFGEPYGTLILTLAAVSVEVVILIVLLQGEPNPTLARDTVFAAIMFDVNGILGLAAIVGGLKHGSSKIQSGSANSYIAMLLVAIGVGMFIPDFVPEAKWQIYSAFSIGTMAIMYLAFLRLQTVEHRRFFEYSEDTAEEAHDAAHSPHALHVSIMVGAIILVGLLVGGHVCIARCRPERQRPAQSHPRRSGRVNLGQPGDTNRTASGTKGPHANHRQHCPGRLARHCAAHPAGD